jgi:hypothetical protein
LIFDFWFLIFLFFYILFFFSKTMLMSIWQKKNNPEIWNVCKYVENIFLWILIFEKNQLEK